MPCPLEADIWQSAEKKEVGSFFPFSGKGDGSFFPFSEKAEKRDGSFFSFFRGEAAWPEARTSPEGTK